MPAQRSHTYKKRKRKKRLRLFLTLFISILLFAILLLSLVLLALHRDAQEAQQTAPTTSETEAAAADVQQSLPAAQALAEPESESGDAAAARPDLQETDIYTFLQGPKAWEARVDWSGSWCHEVLADQEFSVFGCGLCDLASIYSTLTPYDCSPLDMYDYAQEVSGYTPVSGYGAIDWPHLKKTLKTTGIASKLKRKGNSYEQFQENVADAITVIALVSSYEDSTYWQDVEGHYVNLWLYDPDTDTVMLGDSGNPDHNRQRIPLRLVYDALKTASRYQYLMVTGVDEEANTWQHDGIDIKWKKPKYYASMKKKTS